MLFSLDKSFPNPIMYIAHNARMCSNNIPKPKSRESDIMIIIVILSMRYMKMCAQYLMVWQECSVRFTLFALCSLFANTLQLTSLLFFLSAYAYAYEMS